MKKKFTKKTHSTETCSIEFCTEGASVAGLCHNCYQSLWYWKNKKGVGDVIRRHQQVKKLNARMDIMVQGTRARRAG